MSLSPLLAHHQSLFTRGCRGDAGPLEPQARALNRKLGELRVGVDIEALFLDARTELQHEYQFNLNTAEGQEAFRRSVSFIKRVTN